MKIKQVVIPGQNQAELRTLELDETLKPDELLVNTEYTFISAGTELANYTGRETDVFVPGSWCAYPWCPGYANVGIVRAVGAAVTRFKPGDRVFSTGKHASVVKLDQKYLIVPVPDGLDPSVAAASRMAGVSTSSVVMADLRPHPWVVVFGLGMVGNLAAQAFGILGGRVIGVDPVASRRKLAAACGLRWTIGGSSEEALAEIKKLTGEGADITVEATGLTPVVLQAIQATANVGQTILLGSPRAPMNGDVTLPLKEIHLRNLTVRGALEWCPPAYPVRSVYGQRTFHIPSLYSKQMMIFDWLLQGQMKIAPLITHHMPPSAIKPAYEGLLRETETYVGVVLDWGKAG
jgi:2-desacetyl-2-hydroxyethyl bacteriochlorophyllide A dehydrogenase